MGTSKRAQDLVGCLHCDACGRGGVDDARRAKEIDEDLEDLAWIRAHHAAVERECLQLREELAAAKKDAAAGRGECVTDADAKAFLRTFDGLTRTDCPKCGRKDTYFVDEQMCSVCDTGNA